MVKRNLMVGLVMFFMFTLSTLSAQNWLRNWNDVISTAQKEHKNILLNFSGSDWCLPCIRMHKNIFGSDTFIGFANEHLVLYNADFPRSKKNQPLKEIVAQNERLADIYNKEGHFPFTLLIDENGKVLKSWTGFYEGGTDNFIAELKGN
jgi:thioredoxin-related protein